VIRLQQLKRPATGGVPAGTPFFVPKGGTLVGGRKSERLWGEKVNIGKRGRVGRLIPAKTASRFGKWGAILQGRPRSRRPRLVIIAYNAKAKHHFGRIAAAASLRAGPRWRSPGLPAPFTLFR